MVFVNSMSDLFHGDVPDEFVLRVFDVMLAANWYVYQVLTKRPARAARFWERHRGHFALAHGLPVDAAKLPAGWQDRVIPVRDDVATNGKIGLCVEAHDLAASKLVAFRDKDRDFVRMLLKEKLVKPKLLEARIRAMELSSDDRDRLVKWVKLTAKGLRVRKSR